MAKIFGLFGSMKGKVADVVMVVRNGEQIVRKYQPIVSNPKSAAQVQTRAKLKLMSQLSAVMAPYIAMRREGPVSSRNMFVKSNYPLTTYNNNKADISLVSVQLTKSVLGFSPVTATRTGTTLNLVLGQSAVGLDRVVYVAVFQQEDGSLRAAGSTVVTEPGQNNTFAGTINVLTQAPLPIVVFAYGVRDITEAARVAFSNMKVSAENVASIVTTRSLTDADISLTETKAVEVSAEG